MARKCKKRKHKKKSRSYYGVRDRVLKEMGFSSYEKYRQSKIWRDFLVEFPYSKCVCCGEDATCYHHKNYNEDTLNLQNTLENIYPLCKKCHYAIEFTKKKKKRFSQQMIHQAFMRLVLANNRLPPNRCSKCYDFVLGNEYNKKNRLCDRCKK